MKDGNCCGGHSNVVSYGAVRIGTKLKRATCGVAPIVDILEGIAGGVEATTACLKDNAVRIESCDILYQFSEYVMFWKGFVAIF